VEEEASERITFAASDATFAAASLWVSTFSITRLRSAWASSINRLASAWASLRVLVNNSSALFEASLVILNSSAFAFSRIVFASPVAVETILLASLSEASYSVWARFLKSLTYFSVSALKLLTSLFASSINFAFSSLVAASCAAEVSLIPWASFSASTKTDWAFDLAALIKVAASSPARAVISASSNSKTFGILQVVLLAVLIH